MLGNTEFLAKDVAIEYEGHSAKADIRWEIEPEVRSWGIKGLGIFIPEQKITFCIQVDNPETGDEEDKDVELDLAGCTVDLDRERSYSDDICPRSIEVWEGKIKVYF